MNNVTVTEDNVFNITDDSSNAGLRLNVSLNESAYRNMLPRRDLNQIPVHSASFVNLAPNLTQSATTIVYSGVQEVDVQPAVWSEESSDNKNGKEEAE